VILQSPDRQGLSGNRTSIPRMGGEEESSRLTRDRDGRERGVAALPAGGGRRGARRAARPASPRPPSRLAGSFRWKVSSASPQRFGGIAAPVLAGARGLALRPCSPLAGDLRKRSGHYGGCKAQCFGLNRLAHVREAAHDRQSQGSKRNRLVRWSVAWRRELAGGRAGLLS
jgi:hypothetical protein